MVCQEGGCSPSGADVLHWLSQRPRSPPRISSHRLYFVLFQSSSGRSISAPSVAYALVKSDDRLTNPAIRQESRVDGSVGRADTATVNNYEVRVTRLSGATTTIACSGRNVDATAARESKPRTVVHAEIYFAGAYICTFINGVRAYGSSD